MEGYQSVKKWLRDIAFERSGSVNTKKYYLAVLRLFSRFIGKSPDEMVSECASGAVSDYVEKTKAFTMAGDRAKGTVLVYSHIIKSFFDHNGILLPIGRIQNWVTYEDRAVAPEELHRLLQASNLRTRAEISVLAQSGMRVGTLAGLTYGHVKEGLEKGEVPLRIHISSMEAKGRVRSFDTFIGSEAIDYLKLYLESRQRGTKKIPGEKLTERSPLFRDQRGKDAKALRYVGIYADIRKALLNTGLAEKKGKPSELRPHSLRKFFKTQLEAAGVSRMFIEFMMGHTLPGTDSAYFKPTLEQLREAYLKGISYLSMTPRRDVKDEFKRVLEAVKARREDPEISGLANRFLEALSEEKWIGEAPSRAKASNSAHDTCLKCGSVMDQDAFICDQCGAKLKVECGKCKMPNRVEAKYCKNCGEKL